MHAREIIVILFIILMILFGVRSYAFADKTHTRESMNVQRITEYPAHVTSNDSFEIDPVTLANTQNNKYVSAAQMHEPMPTMRKKKNVSFAPQKEVARYSKQDGDIKDIVTARV